MRTAVLDLAGRVFQTNTEMAERLYAIALELAALRGEERVFDLYCGIGTISLALARVAGEVHGLEVVEPAVADDAPTRSSTASRTRAFAPATSASPCGRWSKKRASRISSSSTRRAPACRRRSSAA